MPPATVIQLCLGLSESLLAGGRGCRRLGPSESGGDPAQGLMGRSVGETPGSSLTRPGPGLGPQVGDYAAGGGVIVFEVRLQLEVTWFCQWWQIG